MHFYQVYAASDESKYFRLKQKLASTTVKAEKTKFLRRLRLLNIVEIGDKTYQLYEKGKIEVVKDGDTSYEFTMCKKCIRQKKTLIKVCRQSKKPCVLVPGLK